MKSADILGRDRVRVALAKCSEALAAVTMAPLRHWVAGGGRRPAARTERGVRNCRTTLFGSRFTAFTEDVVDHGLAARRTW